MYQEQLKLLCEILTEIDSQPVRSMAYITNATKTTAIHNKPPDDIRWLLLRDILHKSFMSFALSEEDQNQAPERAYKLLAFIDQKYQQNQQLCWQSHSHHFHESFEKYVNCPVTCLWELVEFISKIQEKIYAV